MGVYAYLRVSTEEQCYDRQITSIKRFRDVPDDKIFIDKKSGRTFDRPEWTTLKRILREGDELIVAELDRLGRTKAGIKEEMDALKKKGVTLRALDIPTTLMDFKDQEWLLQMISSILIEVYSTLAEREVTQKKERQRQGIEEAKKRGVYKGRKPIEVDAKKLATIHARWRAGALKTVEAQSLLGVKSNTFYRLIDRFEASKGIKQTQ